MIRVNSTSNPEKAVTGETLYEATRSIANLIPVGEQILSGDQGRAWAELPWSEQDKWEAQADEINEARRGTP